MLSIRDSMRDLIIDGINCLPDLCSNRTLTFKQASMKITEPKKLSAHPLSSGLRVFSITIKTMITLPNIRVSRKRLQSDNITLNLLSFCDAASYENPVVSQKSAEPNLPALRPLYYGRANRPSADFLHITGSGACRRTAAKRTGSP